MHMAWFRFCAYDVVQIHNLCLWYGSHFVFMVWFTICANGMVHILCLWCGSQFCAYGVVQVLCKWCGSHFVFMVWFTFCAYDMV